MKSFEELWQIKDDWPREANYDVHVLCQKLREEQENSESKIVDRSVPPVVSNNIGRPPSARNVPA